MKTFLHPIAESKFGANCRGSRFFGSIRASLGALAVLSGLSATPARAQVIVKEIAPADLVENQYFGDSISANSTHFAVGTVQADKPATATTPLITGAGAVYLFSLTTGAQTRKIFSPLPATNGQFGRSVALAGNLLAVSAPLEDANGVVDSGAVYLFNATTGALIKQITAASANGGGGAGGDQFGFAVAMEGDYLVIGAPYHDGAAVNVGAIYIYNLRTGIISGASATNGYDYPDGHYGSAVAVQGGFIAVGQPDAGDFVTTEDFGAVNLVDATTGAELRRFTASDYGAFDHFGTSVAFSRNRLIVGAPGWNANDGKAYAYNASPFGLNAWAELWTSEGSNDSALGSSIAASGDLVVIGAPGGNSFAFNSGIVMVLSSRGTVVHSGGLYHSGLFASGQAVEDRLGKQVAISGNTILALATRRDSRALDSGSAFKFSPVRSPLPFFETAIKGESPPGALDASFSSFNQLALSPIGFTAFDANVVGTGASAGRTSGIWSTTFGPTKNVRRTGVKLAADADPDLRKGVDFTNPVSNFDGLLGFTATTSGAGITTANDKVFAVCEDAVLTPVMKLPLVEGTTTVGSGLLSTFQPPRQTYKYDGSYPFSFAVPYTNRLSAAGGVTTTNDSGIAIFDKSGIVNFTGTVLPAAISEGSGSPVGGFNYGQVLPRVSFCSTNLIYASFLQGSGAANNLAVFSYDGVAGQVWLAQKGLPTPGFTSGTSWGTFSNFLGEAQGYYAPNPDLNGAVLRASVIPPAGSPTRNEGIWRWSNEFGAFRLQLLKGDATDPALPGMSILSFVRFGATLEDHTIAWVRLQGPGVTTANDGAILLSRNTYGVDVRAPTNVLLREGFPAPGCGRARIGTIQTVDTGTNGSYAVLATLIVEPGGATASDNQALFLGAFAIGGDGATVYALPRLMLRKGTQFVRSGSPTVKSISLPGYTTDATGAMNTGLARLVKSDSGYFPVCGAVVTFNDGQTSVLGIYP